MDRPSIGACLNYCTKYDGPSRKGLQRYTALTALPSFQKPRHAQILVGVPPATAYIGDRMGAAIGKMTGRKPCSGCRKVESGLNWAHRSLEKLLT